MARHIILPLAAALALAGCGEDDCASVACSPCPPPFATVSVSDAQTGGPVPGATATGGTATWACVEADGATRCTPEGFLSGTPPIAVTVSAPGYASATTQVVTLPASPPPPPQCCPACASYAAAPVTLSPP